MNKIDYGFLTLEEEKLQDKFRIQYGNIVKEIDDDIVKLAAMITRINGESKQLLEKYNYLIETLDPQAFSKMASAIGKQSCGIKPYLTIDCEHCGGTALVAVPFRGDFFLPEYTA